MLVDEMKEPLGNVILPGTVEEPFVSNTHWYVSKLVPITTLPAFFSILIYWSSSPRYISVVVGLPDIKCK